jgi:hypothetical protein
VKRGATPWEAPLASAVISPPLTALIEAAWYMVVRHIPFWEVLGANIDPDMAFRPSAYVAVAGAGIAMIAFLRKGPIPRPSAASLRVQRRPEAADGLGRHRAFRRAASHSSRAKLAQSLKCDNAEPPRAFDRGRRESRRHVLGRLKRIMSAEAAKLNGRSPVVHNARSTPE